MWGLIGFVIAISVLVVVHEFGHYAVARACGVRVLAFSIGFGRVLYERTDRHGTRWRISALPFGGYVQMLDEQSAKAHPEISQKDFARESFDGKSVWARMAVVAAGPIMNFVLAVVIYAIVAMAGMYEPSSKLDAPIANTQAAQVGVERGWHVEAVGNDSVHTFNDLPLMLIKHIGEERVPVRFSDTTGAQIELPFRLTGLTTDEQTRITTTLGLMPYAGNVVIGKVRDGGPAAQAGVRAPQVVLAIDEMPVHTLAAFTGAVQKSTGPIKLLLQDMQTKAERTVVVQPEFETDETGARVARIGVFLGGMPDLVYTRKGPMDAIFVGFEKTWDVLALTAVTLGKLVTGQASTDMISGPLMIGDAAGHTLQVGWMPFVLFLAMLSVNLGLLNLLPVPLLDGGHILFYAYEIVTGKKPSERVLIVGQKIGIGFVILVMVLGLTNDITRIFG